MNDEFAGPGDFCWICPQYMWAEALTALQVHSQKHNRSRTDRHALQPFEIISNSMHALQQHNAEAGAVR